MPKPKAKHQDPKAKPRRRGRRDEDGAEFREKNRLDRVDSWIPKTGLGKKVKNGEITDINQLFDSGAIILEPQIIDVLIPNLSEKLVEFKKTARISQSGRHFSYRATVLIGNKNGFVGVGVASDRERQAAAQKASGQAKLNLVRIYRGCGSWECVCGTRHSLPFKVHGQCGSIRVHLFPAPKGVGLVVGNNVKEVFDFAGISDVWSETKGSTATRLNFIRAVVDALSKTATMRQSEAVTAKLQHQKHAREDQ